MHDLRHAFRNLARSPGLAGLVVLTLTLGVGANTAIYSVLRGVALKPLPYDEPERLVVLCERNPAVTGYCVASPPDVADLAAAPSLEGIGLGRGWPFSLKTAEGSEGVRGGYAVPALFDVLRFRPLHGRLFFGDELESDKRHVALISHRFSVERFGGGSSAIGGELVLDGESYTVVGVLPPEAEVPTLDGIDVWQPLPFAPTDEENRGWRGFTAIARLAPGAELQTASSELRTISERLAAAYPETNAGWDVETVPLHEELLGEARQRLLLFQGAVALVLLIGCANVANLLLARAAGRRRDLAVRAALGAGRARLARLVLVEGLVLAVLGGLGGLAFAAAAVRSFLSLAPGNIPRLDEIRLDGGVAAFAALAALVTAGLCSAVPALRASRLRLVAALKGAGEEDGRHRPALLGGLVSAEAALAVVLLVGAGLLLRSFLAATSWRSTYDPAHVLTLSAFTSTGTYSQGADAVAAFHRAAEELRSLPGVESVGTGSAGTLFGGRETDPFVEAGHGDDEAVVARWFDVGPQLLPTLGRTLVAGRHFTYDDDSSRPNVAIVNETLARALWGEDDPLGRRLESLDRELHLEVVGVVRDEPPAYPRTTVEPEIFWPNLQMHRWATFFVLRTSVAAGTLTASVRDRLRQTAPDLDLGRIATLEERQARRLVSPRFNAWLVGLFAGVGLALAVIGTYGVIAYGVARRTREIGLRMALGADRRHVVRLVLRQGLSMTALGAAAGVAGALSLEGALRGLVYAVAPTDPASYVLALGVLGAAAFAACYLPARRAASVDPMSSIRVE